MQWLKSGGYNPTMAREQIRPGYVDNVLTVTPSADEDMNDGEIIRNMTDAGADYKGQAYE